MTRATVTPAAVTFRYGVMYLSLDGNRAHLVTVEAHNPEEARIKVLGIEPTVLFEESPVKYSEADHARH